MSKPRELPLDDPRWLPSSEAFVRLRQHFGSKGVAEREIARDEAEDAITRALREGLGCLNRYRTSDGVWERRLVPFLCWTMIEWTEGFRNRTIRRPAPTEMDRESAARPAPRPSPLELGLWQPGLGYRGAVLYFWRPDLERRWPTVFPPAHEPLLPEPTLEVAAGGPIIHGTLSVTQANQTISAAGTLTSAKFSFAALEKCFRDVMAERMRERPDDPLSEGEMWAEVNRRLDTHVTREALRAVWGEIAPEWKKERGRPAR